MRNPAKQLRKAVQAGDEAARKVVRDLAEETAAFVSHVVNLMEPDVVSLGGSVAEELHDWILPVVLKLVRQESPAAERVQIVVSGLGKNAGIVGGAVLASRGGKPLGRRA
jgi:predicted NBD/HSP70 family sugar kinase